VPSEAKGKIADCDIFLAIPRQITSPRLPTLEQQPAGFIRIGHHARFRFPCVDDREDDGGSSTHDARWKREGCVRR
jgi:hypothetical protein